LEKMNGSVALAELLLKEINATEPKTTSVRDKNRFRHQIFLQKNLPTKLLPTKLFIIFQ